MATTPYILGGVTFLVITSGGRNSPMVVRALGGAMSAGIATAALEYTWNSKEHNAATKWQIILGSSAIGAGSGIVGPFAHDFMRIMVS